MSTGEKLGTKFRKIFLEQDQQGTRIEEARRVAMIAEERAIYARRNIDTLEKRASDRAKLATEILGRTDNLEQNCIAVQKEGERSFELFRWENTGYSKVGSASDLCGAEIREAFDKLFSAAEKLDVHIKINCSYRPYNRMPDRGGNRRLAIDVLLDEPYTDEARSAWMDTLERYEIDLEHSDSRWKSNKEREWADRMLTGQTAQEYAQEAHSRYLALMASRAKAVPHYSD